MGVLHTLLADPGITPAGAGLAGALIGAGSALAITLVNGVFNHNRFQRERLWERRQAACNEIVSALRIAQMHGARIDAGFGEDADRYLGSKQFSDDNEQYKSFIKNASNAFHFNYLILPTAFRLRFERMMRDQVQFDYEVGPDSYLGPMGVVEAATPDLMDIALSELKIAGFWARAVGRARRILRSLVFTARLQLKRRNRHRVRDSL